MSTLPYIEVVKEFRTNFVWLRQNFFYTIDSWHWAKRCLSKGLESSTFFFHIDIYREYILDFLTPINSNRFSQNHALMSVKVICFPFQPVFCKVPMHSDSSLNETSNLSREKNEVIFFYFDCNRVCVKCLHNAIFAFFSWKWTFTALNFLYCRSLYHGENKFGSWKKGSHQFTSNHGPRSNGGTSRIARLYP